LADADVVDRLVKALETNKQLLATKAKVEAANWGGIRPWFIGYGPSTTLIPKSHLRSRVARQTCLRARIVRELEADPEWEDESTYVHQHDLAQQGQHQSIELREV